MAKSNIILPQNANLWRALREQLNIDAAQPPSFRLSSDVINPVYQIGQGGYLNPSWYVFQTSAISVNGAAADYTVETGTPASSSGNAPTIADNARLQHGYISLAGGTVTPLLFSVRIQRGANNWIMYRASLTNPGHYAFPHPMWRPGGQELLMNFHCSAGGAGDTFAVHGLVVHNVQGAELPTP